MRMDYKVAIEYLREHDIKKDDGTYYEFGNFLHLIFSEVLQEVF